MVIIIRRFLAVYLLQRSGDSLHADTFDTTFRRAAPSQKGSADYKHGQFKMLSSGYRTRVPQFPAPTQGHPSQTRCESKSVRRVVCHIPRWL